MADMEMLIERVRRTSSREEARKLLNAVRKCRDGSNDSFTSFVVACMKNPYPQLLHAGAYVIRKITWTESEKYHLAILDQLFRGPRISSSTADGRAVDAVLNGFAAIAHALKKILSKATPSRYFVTKIVQLFACPFSPRYSEYHAAVCGRLLNCVDWRIADVEVKLHLGQVVERFLLSHSDLRYFDAGVYLKPLLNRIWSQYVDGMVLDPKHERCLALVSSFAEEVTRSCPLNDPQDSTATFFGNIVWYTMEFFYRNLGNQEIDLLRQFVPLCWHWRQKIDHQLTKPEKALKAEADRCLRRAMQQNPTVLGELFEDMCDAYFSNADLAVLASIQIAYLNAKTQPQIQSTIEKMLPRLLKSARSTSDPNEKLTVAQLTNEVAKENPAILRTHINTIEHFLDHKETCQVSLATLKTLAPYLPGHGDSYFGRVHRALGDNKLQHAVVETLKAIAIFSEADCERIVGRIRSEIERQTSEDRKVDTQFAQAVAQCFSELVIKYRAPFDKRRDLLRSLKKQYPLISVAIRSITDYLDGRLKVDSDGSDRRFNKFSQESIQTGDTSESTLHFVNRPPPWSEEVCHLLNKPGKNDWRALANRLAYGANEIRMWTAQVDPCSWLLKDFYAVNKSSDATRHLVRVLTELKRFDAIDVIEEYEDAGEQSVTREYGVARRHRDPDGTHSTLGSSPNSNRMMSGFEKRRIHFAQACLSCSPDKIYSMESLKRSLESRGFACQICSFDSLGMDECGAEVVICALSMRYELSSAAERTVEQADRRQKIVIPLLMDNMQYPPEGAMKPVFSRLAPIDCREMMTQLNWEGERPLAEVLSRLRAHAPHALSPLPHLDHDDRTRLPPGRRSIWRQRPASPPPAISSNDPLRYTPIGRQRIIPRPAWEEPLDPNGLPSGQYDSDEEQQLADDDDSYYDELDYDEDNVHDESDEFAVDRRRRNRTLDESDELRFGSEDPDEIVDDEFGSEDGDRGGRVGPAIQTFDAQQNPRFYYQPSSTSSYLGPPSRHRSSSLDDVSYDSRDYREPGRFALPPSLALAQRRNLSPAMGARQRLGGREEHEDRAAVKLPSLYRQRFRNY